MMYRLTYLHMKKNRWNCAQEENKGIDGLVGW